jgi:hypothetical protein
MNTAFVFAIAFLLATMSSPSAKALNLSIFAGKWKGKGSVFKKTGGVATTYLETATFEIARKTPDFVVYRMHQDTKNAETSKPMHTETGFCKILSETGAATMTQAHPFPSGFIGELAEGQLREDGTLTLVAKDFQRAVKTTDKMDKQVTGFKREYKRSGDKLIYDQYLSSDGSELFHHLHCEMDPISDE